MVMKYQSDEELANMQGIDPATGKPLSSAPGDTLSPNVPVQNVSQQGTGGGGTGFTSITQYLEQNRPQAAKLASQVGSYVSGKGEAARGALDEGQAKFNASSNAISLDQDLLNKAMTAPTDVIKSPDEFNKFNEMKGAEYSGPKSLEETDYFGGINKALEEAKTAGTETQSEEGKRVLLTEMAKSPNVTPGMTSLNNLLLSNPEARDKLTTAREGMSDLDQRLADASAAAKTRATANTETNTATSKAVADALKNTYGTFESGINARELSEEEKAQKNIDAFKKILSSTSMPQPWTPPPGVSIKPGMNLFPYGVDPSYLGMTQEQLDSLLRKNIDLESPDQQLPYWNNPGNYYTNIMPYFSALNPQTEITRENVATPEEYAKWSALNQLAGTPDTYGATQGFLPDKYAGAYNPDMVNFDYVGANSAMLANYRAAIQSALDAYNKAQENSMVKIGLSPQSFSDQTPGLYQDWAGTQGLNT